MLTTKRIYSCLSKVLAGAIISFASLTGEAQAQKKITLRVGDAAPPLHYFKWIQGATPIRTIDTTSVYVFEFWATWCGPCIAAMPHLSELSKKYEGKITFVGCDVWEKQHGGKNQESYVTKVTDFVKQQNKLGRLTYNVMMDNDAEFMGNNWLKAAGQDGIPSSFVIQNGRLAWIGHPAYLDSILKALDEGTLNVADIIRKNKAAEERSIKAAAAQKEAMQLYKTPEEAKDYATALRMIDTVIARHPEFKHIVVMDKLRILQQHFGEDAMIAYGRELMNDRFMGQMLCIYLMDDKNAGTQKLKEFYIEALKKVDPAGIYYRVSDALADAYARAGHYREAAESARNAAKIAKEDMKKPGFNGSVTEADIANLLNKAKELDKKAEKH